MRLFANTRGLPPIYPVRLDSQFLERTTPCRSSTGSGRNLIINGAIAQNLDAESVSRTFRFGIVTLDRTGWLIGSRGNRKPKASIQPWAVLSKGDQKNGCP